MFQKVIGIIISNINVQMSAFNTSQPFNISNPGEQPGLERLNCLVRWRIQVYRISWIVDSWCMVCRDNNLSCQNFPDPRSSLLDSSLQSVALQSEHVENISGYCFHHPSFYIWKSQYYCNKQLCSYSSHTSIVCCQRVEASDMVLNIEYTFYIEIIHNNINYLLFLTSRFSIVTIQVQVRASPSPMSKSRVQVKSPSLKSKL